MNQIFLNHTALVLTQHPHMARSLHAPVLRSGLPCLIQKSFGSKKREGI